MFPVLTGLTAAIVGGDDSNFGSDTDLFKLLLLMLIGLLIFSIIVCGSGIAVFEIDMFWVWNGSRIKI